MSDESVGLSVTITSIAKLSSATMIPGGIKKEFNVLRVEILTTNVNNVSANDSNLIRLYPCKITEFGLDHRYASPIRCLMMTISRPVKNTLHNWKMNLITNSILQSRINLTSVIDKERAKESDKLGKERDNIKKKKRRKEQQEGKISNVNETKNK